ncbi:conjugal transfer protein TraN [Rugamonas aquatica]|uniref:Conjugal transfer protein TraN n=1 Tax=Rugamonas aquatica TaxID=2743357 RepID=A0A6A7N6Q4_9BURK|nr:conjugal transfer protein TraN [Rugamonas aquatica]MQA40588.1 hypothetical protein [Rugamonas aquatica]
MKPRMVWYTLWCFNWALCASAYGQAPTPMPEGVAANAAIAAMINQPTASTVVPGYTTNPPELSLAGKDLKAAAALRLNACLAAPADPVCTGQVAATNAAATPRIPSSEVAAIAAAAQAIARDPLSSHAAIGEFYSGCNAHGCPPSGTFCFGESCFDTKAVADTDFAQTMSFMEAAREAGVYLDPDRITVFNGAGDSCRMRALKNCCGTDGAGVKMSNGGVFGSGSVLVYDVLMNSGNREFLYQGVKAMLTADSYGGTFTSFGVTFASGGTALPSGSVLLTSGDNFAVAFDPWSLAIMVIIMVVTNLLSCSQAEAKMALQEGAKLCHSIGTFCSHCLFRNPFGGGCAVCDTYSTGKCCFNSMLSRIINEQGRAQLGKGWGSGDSPQCTGFTVAQLLRLDFSRMDLSEFYASLAPKIPDAGKIIDSAVKAAPKCYAGAGKC